VFFEYNYGYDDPQMPALIPMIPAIKNNPNNFNNMLVMLNVFRVIIWISVNAETMHNTSVIADSIVNIE
jgi:hypothetical protein